MNQTNHSSRLEIGEESEEHLYEDQGSDMDVDIATSNLSSTSLYLTTPKTPHNDADNVDPVAPAAPAPHGNHSYVDTER